MTDAPVSPSMPLSEVPLWRRVMRHRGAASGFIIFSLLVLASFVGPLVWTVDPARVDILARNQGPSPVHPFGTDQLGRDMLARLLTGGRVSISVGVAAMLLSISLGTAIGILAGFFKGLDSILMRFSDLFLSLPILPLLLVMVMLLRDPLAAAFGPETGVFILLVTAIGGTSWMQTARIVRGETLSLKTREYVLAATMLGTSRSRVLSSHILPNVIGSVAVSATLGVASAIITESSLSFLGLGFPPDFPSWGRILFDSVDQMRIAPLRVFLPGATIVMTVLSVNYLGDGLRDAFDPRSSD